MYLKNMHLMVLGTYGSGTCCAVYIYHVSFIISKNKSRMLINPTMEEGHRRSYNSGSPKCSMIIATR